MRQSHLPCHPTGWFLEPRVLGEHARLLETVEGPKVELTGVGDLEVSGLKLGLGVIKVDTLHDGPVILLCAQHACLGKGCTVHSKGQMQHFSAIVDNASRSCGSRQCVITHEGCVIPIHIRDRLPSFDESHPANADLDKCPHLCVTDDSPWDPSVLNDEHETDNFHDAISEDPDVIN